MDNHRNRIQSLEIENVKAKNIERDTLTSLKQKTKVNIIKNNLRVVGLVNFIVLVGLIFSVSFSQWYYLSDKSPIVWSGFLFIHVETYGNFFNYKVFKADCDYILHSQECSLLDTFEIMGLGCFIALLLSILLHGIYVLQIFLIIFEKVNLLQKWFCPKPVYLKYLILTVYVGVILLWGLYCAIKSLSVKKLGISYWTLCGSTILYLLLVCYYNIMKKELKKRKMISNLLDADKYIGTEGADYSQRRDSDALAETFSEIPVF